MGTVKVEITGNLTADPELRFIPNGDAVASFRVASTTRVKKDNEWVDGDTVFLKVTAWRHLAETAAETLTKGTPVIVTGKLKQGEYEKDGVKVTTYEVVADFIGTKIRAANGGNRGSSDSWASNDDAPF